MFDSAHKYATDGGLLTLAPTGHGAVFFQFNDWVIYVDPYSETTSYEGFPKADLVLFTHDHYDHYDPAALEHIVTDKTQFAGPSCLEEHIDLLHTFSGNGDAYQWNGITITAVPAYNVLHKNPSGQLFHPKGYGVGYVFAFGNLRVYVAGDTEPIKEMETLGQINIAFLPKNLPYTMSDEQFVEAVKRVKAPIVYPIHYFELNRDALQKAVGKEVTLEFE